MARRSAGDRRKIKSKLFGPRKTVGCCFCRRRLDFSQATLEHVIPLSLGGGTSLENSALSCSSCNLDRGTSDFTLYQAWRRGRTQTKPPQQMSNSSERPKS